MNEKDIGGIRFYYETEDNNNLKSGELIEFEDGEYSNHQVWFPMRVVKDFNLNEAFHEHLKEHPEQLEYMKANYEMFAAFLIRQGYLDDVENVVRRIRLGDGWEWYSSLRTKRN